MEELPAWEPYLKSNTVIRTSHIRHITDPSVTVTALGLEAENLIDNMTFYDKLFRELTIRDLRIYADAIDGTVKQYTDKNGLICDAVIQLSNGIYGLINTTLGGDKGIEECCARLQKLTDKLDCIKMNTPAFSAVITGIGGKAYRRDDGIYVVPIGCLKD